MPAALVSGGLSFACLANNYLAAIVLLCCFSSVWTLPSDEGLVLVISFNINYLPKDPIL